MVIQTSDSCNTLVSLGNDFKESNSYSLVESDNEYIQTALLCPVDEFDSPELPQAPIYLPKDGRVDDYLKRIPQIVETVDEFLANPPRHYNKSSPERILYVGQGEVAHALPSQCDIITSDKATTCHILALRSTSSAHVPLTSLTHLDGTAYEKCIREMFEEHRKYHNSNDNIDTQVYIVGGFNDIDSTSVNISNWLLNTLARITDEQKDFMTVTLKLCAISALNDNGLTCPIGRGLAIDLKSGDAFLAKVDEDVAGPAVTLRSARLFTGSNKLSLIHDGQRSNEFSVEAFHYEPFEGVDQLLQLPDQIMLQYMSTSPDVEEASFCPSLRETLRFVRDVKSNTMFGPMVDQPLRFRRSGRNTWEALP